ncbi:histidine kinase [Nonlabens tegetincola]|uniref:histidine kinase n=1 Tax=Nonlabens tegetincola TaxID=323273 RepID=UPI001FD1677E|nr:histidine kinase [Nonlabens tegetincola]
MISSIRKEIKIDPKNATHHLNKFSRLLRLSLINSTQEYVPLYDELEMVEKYLELQNLRFPNLFIYSIDYIGFNRYDLVKIPPMIIQPFVENCIEHGFNNIDYLGHIKIRFSKNINYKPFLHVEIEDNGQGFKDFSFNDSSLSFNLINNFIYKMTKNIFQLQI